MQHLGGLGRRIQSTSQHRMILFRQQQQQTPATFQHLGGRGRRSKASSATVSLRPVCLKMVILNWQSSGLSRDLDNLRLVWAVSDPIYKEKDRRETDTERE